jgi:hypothetical protein
MQNHKALFRIIVIFTSLVVVSCATNHIPSNWLPSAKETTSNIYGGWIEIKSRQSKLWGELIAVDKDTVFIADTSMRTVATNDILKAQLYTYKSETDIITIIEVIAGTLSTITHGFRLILTAPLWIIFGPIAIIHRYNEPIISFPDKPLKDFTPFSRFPQGLPPKLNRSTIKAIGLELPEATEDTTSRFIE